MDRVKAMSSGEEVLGSVGVEESLGPVPFTLSKRQSNRGLLSRGGHGLSCLAGTPLSID